MIRRILALLLCTQMGCSGSCLAEKARDAREPEGRVLYIAGHNLEAKGALSATKIPEIEYNDGILRALQAVTDSAATSFVYSSDNIQLKQRPALSDSLKSAVYVEIHHDSGQQEDIDRKNWAELQGFSVFYSPESADSAESRGLAESIGRAMLAAGFRVNKYHAKPIKGEGRKLVDPANGVYEAPFYVLKNSEIPAALVECGNIVNPDEEAVLVQEQTKQRLAKAIESGVEAYLKSARQGQ